VIVMALPRFISSCCGGGLRPSMRLRGEGEDSSGMQQQDEGLIPEDFQGI
jgi:hypothetical protein